MSLSPDQIADRLRGISGTDIAALLGCHPYRRPVDVFLDKTGQAAPFTGNLRTNFGTRLEPLIREDYEERHDVTIEVPGTLTHPTIPWYVGSPDGIVYPRRSRTASRGLEIKCHGRDVITFGGIEYGQPGTDEVPPHELCQAMWYMPLTGLDTFDLVAFIDGIPVEYIINRDDDLIDTMIETAERFLADNLRKGIEPQPDGSPAWDRWLNRKWKTNRPQLERIDEDELARALVWELRQARAGLADAERRADLAAQAIKNRIGDGAGLSWRDSGMLKPEKVTWKRSKDGVKQNWRTTAQEMRLLAATVASVIGPRIDKEFGADATTDLILINQAASALHGIAGMPVATTPAPGARPLCVPRHWKTPKPDIEQTDDNQEETTAS